MKKFSSIESFKHVLLTLKHGYKWKIENIPNYLKENKPGLPVLNYTGTVKLHGTNTGIRREIINNKEIFTPQGRNRTLALGDDNYGFAKWVNDLSEKVLVNLFNVISESNPTITIFGEWIGKGIQKNVAVSKIEKKQWVIYNAYVEPVDGREPYYIRIPPHCDCPVCGIYSINAVKSYSIIIDFNNPEPSIKKIERLVEEVEQECPWGKMFDIEGIGEGIVWCPTFYVNNTALWFKTKGEKHKVTKEKTLIPIDLEKVANVNECVDTILTDARMEQGYTELFVSKNIDPTMKNLGEFIKWVGQDCKKEELSTIVENNLEWKDVSKEIIDRVKKYFINKINI